GSERFSKLSTYTGRGSLEGWLRTVLAQSWVDRYRKQRRLVSLEEETEAGRQFAAAESPPQPGADPRLAAATDEALGALAAEDRFILAAYFLDGHTLAEIGATLAVHESTISRRMARIVRERLQTVTAANATEHPEANLLSAFSENLLRADERDQVLQHLATCAACRQVVALAAVSRREREPLVVTERRPLRWKILRWTALGASAAAMVAVVAVYQQRPRRQLEPTGATITARLEQAPA